MQKPQGTMTAAAPAATMAQAHQQQRTVSWLKRRQHQRQAAKSMARKTSLPICCIEMRAFDRVATW